MNVAAVSPEIEGFRRERHRRAWLTAKVSILARGAGYVSRLIVIPLSLKILGAERYGLWLSVGSIIAWLGMTDFGFSRGLVNAIAEASGRKDRDAIRRLISSGFFAFAMLSLLAVAIVVPASGWHGIDALLNIRHDAALAGDARALVLICGLYFALSFSLRAAGSVCEGLQEGYVGAGFDAFSSIAGVVGSAVLYWRGAGLVLFAVVMSAPSLLGNLALAVYVLLFRYRDLRPRVALVQVHSIRCVMHFGGPLMAVQLASLTVMSSMNLLIANRLSPAAVPRYTVPYSVFMIALGVCWLLIQPYVPAFAESSQRGDTAWVRATLRRLLLITMLITAAAALIIVVAGPFIIEKWAGAEVVPTRGFLLLMSAYALMSAWVGTVGTFLIGIGATRAKAWLATSNVLLFIPAAWLLLPGFNISAIPLAGIISYSVEAIVSLPYGLRRLRRAAPGIEQHQEAHVEMTASAP